MRRKLEDPVQIAIRERLLWHGITAWHIPNGGSRHPLEAKRLKALGVRAGVPDLVCPIDNGVTAWLEVKVPGYSPSDVSEAQREAHDFLRRKGHFVAIVTSQDEAVAALQAAGMVPCR